MPPKKKHGSFVEVSKDGKKARCTICAPSIPSESRQWVQYKHMTTHLTSSIHKKSVEALEAEKSKFAAIGRSIRATRRHFTKPSSAVSTRKNDTASQLIQVDSVSSAVAGMKASAGGADLDFDMGPELDARDRFLRDADNFALQDEEAAGHELGGTDGDFSIDDVLSDRA